MASRLAWSAVSFSVLTGRAQAKRIGAFRLCTSAEPRPLRFASLCRSAQEKVETVNEPEEVVGHYVFDEAHERDCRE
jgi:hypothetical protein